MTQSSPAKLRDSTAAMDYSYDSRPCVYFIQCTVSLNCYIGSTKQPRDRIRTHFSELLKGRHHCQPLQRSFQKYGAEAFVWGVCEFVDGDRDALLDREQHWMDLIGDYNTYKIAGSPLGATMALSETERERRRVRGKALAASLTPDQVAYALSKAVEARSGKPLSDDQKKKLSAATKGRPLSAEHRDKITELNKSRQITPESLIKRSVAIKASLAAKSDEAKMEWKNNLSNACMGRPSPMKGVKMSDASRMKMSASGKGKVISPEQKAKLSAAIKAKSPEWFKARGERIKEGWRKKREAKQSPE